MDQKVTSGIQISSLPSVDNIVPITDLGCEDLCREYYEWLQKTADALEKTRLVRNLKETKKEITVELYSDDPSAHSYLPNPSFSENIVGAYCTGVRQLGFRLQEAISESLGLDKDKLKDVLGELGQHMAVNYYPACPEPELTYGLPAHTDPNALTILLQDLQVAGLQVLKDGKWLAVKPPLDAFVINIDDKLQALSNGNYKSVWHHAVSSVASVLCPCDSADVSAPRALTGGEDGVVYRDFTYAEYYNKFWSRNPGEAAAVG
ncbi:Flavanone 3-dioxygenase 2 [Sesamum alatum]|uniref:Flavanone 3-dioxygenase 2 n=1 Tax=Sesamum alatum TaxID=300844 RepID=A0AAE2CE29_9LAMI|nr:Flavanone 3-dioxygenase 2 [Sesamum alatum]